MIIAYDVLRSDLAFDFLGPALCLESDDTFDREAVDLDSPPPGFAYFYLVRAENGCPDGMGTLGYDSNTAERAGRLCP
jgi:hypothetical protein